MTIGTDRVLHRPMTSPVPPVWAGALWVGDLDVRELDDAVARDTEVLRLDGAEGYRGARLLVRRGDTVLGFVEVPVVAGGLAIPVLVDAAARFDRGAAERAESSAPDTTAATVTVVICTRDRADQLRDALRSVLAVDHPAFDVVVVDNASATTATADLIANEFTDPRVRLVHEAVPGLSSARNTGLRHATGDVVAFTDDDVVVDAGWLTAITRAFASAPDVECVSGLVPSGELRTPVQRYFDDRVSWSRNLRRREFRLAEQPADLPMFPFSVGEFGTGANFALRRRTALELGGFDTAFGAGTRTGGGEDLDVFTRVLFAGGALVVDPSALVWHRHRSDLAALRSQAKGYGVGLGAWLTKVALEPRMAVRAARRAPQAFVRLVGKGAGGLAEGPEHAVGGTDASPPPTVGSAPAGSVTAMLMGSTAATVPTTAGSAAATALTEPTALAATPTHEELAREVRRVGRLELASVLLGPARFLRQRWDGATVLDPASRTAVTDAGAPATASTMPIRRPTPWGIVAALVALVGLTALVPDTAEWWRGIAVGALVLVGPGAALRTWIDMRPSTTVVVVPATGIAVTILLTAAMAVTGIWGVDGALVVIALLTAAGGLDRWVLAGRRPERRTAHRSRVPRFERWLTERATVVRGRLRPVRRRGRAEEGASS
ncbi:glycosyltransferase [Curtobacterium sp. MCBD17_003]|uniref:glycosyltransferase family 2 protein n=1 Tax=Curtobacterium sp. MCBD17_003 TaxID=2175667 RepID=UPI000DA742EA|nr:glycosyltransferase [Curtobacterium sp. MCBD17_003]WIE53751.1 glycosyltransferase [Curtobacterium sp. MCBD17_003]